MLEVLTLKYVNVLSHCVWFMFITHAFIASLNFGSDTIAIGLQNCDFIFLLKICRMQLPLTSNRLEIAD